MGDCCVGVSTVPSVLGRDRCINCFELLKHTKLDRVVEVEAVVLSLNINYSAKRSRKFGNVWNVHSIQASNLTRRRKGIG